MDNEKKQVTYNSSITGETQVTFDIQQYMNNRAMFIGLMCNEDGYEEPFGDVTVNLSVAAPNYCGYLNVNDMPDIEKFITDNDIGEFTGFTQRSGFCEYPLYLFNVDKLRELCPDGMDNLHYEMENRSFERGQTFHNFNDHDYMVLEALSPRNLVVMDMKSGSLTIALGATEYKRYPKDEKPTKDNTTIGVSWEHGIYLGSTLSTTNFKAYKREYGTPEKIEDIYDYRAKLKQKFYFYQDMSKDDDVPKKLQNDFLHQMYEDFGTIEEDCFYDRLEDGKYDGSFKEKQVKEEKSR